MVEEIDGKLVGEAGRVIYEGGLWIDVTLEPSGRKSWLACYQIETHDQVPPFGINCTLQLIDGRTGQCFLKQLQRDQVTLRGTGPLA
jgi:hypothetical protein